MFDSGLGGLTVVREIQKLLPAEQILYLGDNARVPYGTRAAQTVIRYARGCASLLISRGLKMLVVACNTASAVALPTLRDEIEMPVLGVIRAGARAAAQSGASTIGVIGTAGTIRSNAYVDEIAVRAPHSRVVQLPAPLFVPLAEEGWIEGEVPLLAAKRYLEPLVDSNIEVLLLGCTHYPLLKNTICRALSDLGSGARVIDSATAMATDVRDQLTARGLHRESSATGELYCFVTDLPASFEEVASRFLGRSLEQVEVVDI